MRAAREDWFDGQPDLDPDRLVFLDETAAMCGRPLGCKQNLWTGAARDRVLPCVRPLMRRVTCRGPVWECESRDHITTARSKRFP